MTPTLNRILVTPPAAEGEQKSTGGLFIPNIAQERSKFVHGRVIAIGPDVKTVKVNDDVLYNRETAHEISRDGSVVAVLVEDKHIAVIL